MEMIFDQKNHVVRTRDMISHHDVVFRSPVCEPTYGLPIGDGSTGCLLWLTEDALHIQINNTDLVDDLSQGEEYCSGPDETLTFVRNGAQLTVSFGCPVFETIYLDDFEARLSLEDAAAYIHAKTPFAKTDIRAFASQAGKAALIEIETGYEEPVSVSSELSRWGSRSFVHWYSSFQGTTDMGLSGTSSTVERDCMCIVQELQGMGFCIAVKPVADCLTGIKRAGSHAVRAYFAERAHMSQAYYITVGTGEDTECAKERALRQIEEAEKTGREELYRIHAGEWADFWDKSYVSLPEKLDYAENLWYLNLYYANSQMKGEYPAHFCNGVWGFYHDFVPWVGVFHYNTQHFTFPLEAADHPELAEAYYRFRRRQLPYAERFARDVKKGKGAFYTDVCDMKGRMEISTKENSTCGSQIAMEMYWHYRYTGDEDFLQETAMPVIRGAAEYYLNKLVLAQDGYYHIYGTSGYESPYVLLDDCITDLAMIRALFEAFIWLAPEEAGPYLERLDKLVPYQTADFLEGEIDGQGRFLCGVGKGREALTGQVLSIGNHPRLPMDVTQIPDYAKGVPAKCLGKEKARKVFGNSENDYYGFPDIEMAPLFPSGTIGIKDRDSELYKLIYNSICLHPERCMGWCMMPVYLARMGMENMLEEQLLRTISQWMIYPQGFGVYTPTDVDQNEQRYKRNTVRNRNSGKISTALQWKFRHFDYETLPIIATAVNEMLLQSYDGTIRLFPAIKTDSQLAF